MTGNIRKPWMGMALAAVVLVALGDAGMPDGMVVFAALAWFASLWIGWWWAGTGTAPAQPPARTDHDALAREAMCAALERVGLAMVLMRSHRIVAANAAARAEFGAHIVGQDARVALRHPDAVKLLYLADGGSVTIRGLSSSGSLWQLTRQRIDERYWTIELRDRSAEADIDRAHTDFVANASHELRTPLSAIIGYVETLADDPGRVDAETTARFLGIVLREARRMQNLVADLMSLSQLEAEKHDLPTERIDLAAMAARVVGEFPATTPPGKQGSAQTGPRVVLARPEEDIGAIGDVKQLEQMLRNLIDNALKYGDSLRPVEVSLARGKRGMAMIAVRDSGVGIAPDHLPHLTRRFYRTDPGRSRAAGGTGLGLAIVKHIVERHRGKLDISSKLGEGTMVTIHLPFASQDSVETEAEAETEQRVLTQNAASQTEPAMHDAQAPDAIPARQAKPRVAQTQSGVAKTVQSGAIAKTVS